MLLAIAVTVVVAVPVGALSPATGSIGIRLVDAPVSARDDPRAKVYIVDHLSPGTVITRRIEVSNTTASTARLQLYAAAAGIEKSSFLGAAGHTANDLSTWTSVVPGEPDVPDTTRGIGYRIAKEALINVRKHARAANVWVTVQGGDGGLEVSVADDGVGLTAEPFESSPGHRGVVSMQDRAAVAGGRCLVESRPGGGTLVTALLPAAPTRA